MILCTHICACIWYWIGYSTLTDTTDSWLVGWLGIEDQEDTDEFETFELYTYSWYWAVVTLFTTGYGDITATSGNLAECWVSTIAILIGTCLVSYFIGNVSSLVMEGDRSDIFLRDRLDDATAFCDQKKLPRDLTRAILKHIVYHVDNNYVFEEDELIASLPPHLQSQIHQRLAKTVLTQLDFFQSFQRSTGMKETLGEIALKMKKISCNERAFLYEKDDRAKEIYIQRSGNATIDYGDGRMGHLTRGHVVGESACLSPKRKYTVRCTTFCEFYILPVREVVDVLQLEYPKTWKTRWETLLYDLRVSNERRGPMDLRSVNFERTGDDEDDHNRIPSSSGPIGVDGALIDGASNGTTADIANGVQQTTNNGAESPTTPPALDDVNMKKKWVPNIPILHRKSSLSRHLDIVTMAKRREQDQTYMTHDLGAEKGSTIKPVHIRMGSVSLSNDICDIVPGIEVDEEKVEMEVRRMSAAPGGGGLLVPGASSNGASSNGLNGAHPSGQPSAQIAVHLDV